MRGGTAGLTMTEVAPDVFAVQGPLVNWVVLAGRDSVSLIDTGYPRDFARVRASIESTGRSVDDLRSIVLTHGHSDHVGNARRLTAGSEVRVFAHEREVPRVRRAVRAGAPGDGALAAVEAVRDRESLVLSGHPVDVIAMPGHTPGHIALWLPEGDALVLGDSVDDLRRLRPRTVIPGHGPVMRGWRDMEHVRDQVRERELRERIHAQNQERRAYPGWSEAELLFSMRRLH